MRKERAARTARRLRDDDSGQVLVLAIGFVAVALALIATVAAVTSVQLERKRLLSVADAAAAYAAGTYDEALFHSSFDRIGDGAPGPAIVLTDASVAKGAQEYLAASSGVVSLREVQLVSATSPDGQTAVVELSGVARPALVGWLTDVLDDDGGVRIVVQGAARGG
ncbi:hypothetical protein ATL41_0799 [Flavimobilis soli]|uniref:Putative Flp pilus-assembly TadG-like N-terminal domain-containing protein n=1 Tax=Flavimobilis soli TaxID=442709 RepID=A0A2A9ECZ5_9MICO|nr:pilus assembly protein TadG-related protein [Flavimobilis soli]PFG36090.1 hypothetical protein ATL41_0799 [Flavimobilis soli]